MSSRISFCLLAGAVAAACSGRGSTGSAGDSGAVAADATDGAAGPSDAAQRGPLGPPSGIPVIDAHCHVDPRYPDLFLSRFDEAGIAVGVDFQGTPRAVRFLQQAQQSTNGRLRFFCVVPWGSTQVPDFVPQVVSFLEECKGAGGIGLKVSKALGLAAINPADGNLLAVDDPWLDPVFEAAGRLGLPVAMHIGDPQAFFEACDSSNERWEELSQNVDWCFSDRSRYPSWEDLYAQFIRRVERHPTVTFIGVHFGNDAEEPERVGRMMREHPNLWIDIAARVPEFGRHPAEEVRAVFTEFQDRILFGSDLQLDPEMIILGSGSIFQKATQADVERYWTNIWRYFETDDPEIPSPTPIQGRWSIHGINLPREILEKVYWKNASRLLGITL